MGRGAGLKISPVRYRRGSTPTRTGYADAGKIAPGRPAAQINEPCETPRRRSAGKAVWIICVARRPKFTDAPYHCFPPIYRVRFVVRLNISSRARAIKLQEGIASDRASGPRESLKSRRSLNFDFWPWSSVFRKSSNYRSFSPYSDFSDFFRLGPSLSIKTNDSRLLRPELTEINTGFVGYGRNYFQRKVY